MMTQEDRDKLVLDIEEYQILDSWCSHTGMKLFLRDVQEQYDACNRLDNVSTIEDLFYRRGKVDALRVFLGWKDDIQSKLRSLVEQAESEVRLHSNQPTPDLFTDF